MLVESIVSHPLSPTSASPSALLPLWRGTTGLSKIALQSLHVEAAETSTGVAIPWETREVSPTPQEAEEEEVTLVFRSWEGDEAEFEAKVGETLMDLGKRLELGAIEGVCGGVLEVSRSTLPPFRPSRLRLTMLTLIGRFLRTGGNSARHVIATCLRSLRHLPCPNHQKQRRTCCTPQWNEPRTLDSDAKSS